MKNRRKLFKIRYQHRGETYHLAIYAARLKDICLDTQMSLALCLEFHTQICILV